MKRMWSRNELKQHTIELLGSGEVPSIKGHSIIENMSGYSAEIPETGHDNLVIENVYQGVVKNGDKITFVSALKVKRTDDTVGDSRLVNFTIPGEVGAKLYPINLPGYDAGLYFKEVQAQSGYTAFKDIRMLMEKNDNTHVSLWIQGGQQANLTVDTDYYIRFEVTFLLSDNLIQ